ncbi:uncharacterized protein LOC114260168 [Camellia sinensis]|uniref:uncharacterized protein LOC114260168 n=1 Tax=Camellia sinensis TaxID=4442 RepID=UPI001036F22F|nr:uncharacterized protein LOC114260168 [Camellia sinensis]
MKTLADQAEATVKAKDDAEEKADSAEAIKKVLEAEKKVAEEKMAQAQKELQDALAMKEAEIKATDEKAYSEGVGDVMADYEKQVKQACNKGFTLGWMALLKKLEIPEDFPLRNTDVLPLPFSPTPSQSDDDSESEEEALVRKSKEAIETKSPTQNEQVDNLNFGKDGVNERLEKKSEERDEWVVESFWVFLQRERTEGDRIEASMLKEKETARSRQAAMVILNIFLIVHLYFFST